MESEGTSALVRFSDEMADVVERAAGSVVGVHGGRRRPASGVVLSAGLVVTSAHAVEREDGIGVSQGEGRPREARLREARLLGRDHASGVAVLRVEGLDAPVASLAGGEARVGQVALAVGRSARSGRVRASFGIVGGVGAFGGPPFGRKRKSGRRGKDLIQSDAALYPGMSGGALLDARGELIGVTAASPMRGATFAVPAQLAREAAKRIESGGESRRGYLGVLSQPVELTSSQRGVVGQSLGLLVVGVEEGSPADLGGLLVGDVIVRFDGESVEDAEDLLSLLANEKANVGATLEVLRGGTMSSLAVEVGERS